jgi:translation initiation factor 2B subunit (eIF-2B alpha/beta/delta family)
VSAVAGWRCQIERVAADRQSGATGIAKACAEALLAYLEEETPTSVREIEDAIREMATTVLARQSVMAPVVDVFNWLLQALAGASDVEMAVTAVRDTASMYKAQMATAHARMAQFVIGLLPERATVMTLSYSSAVAMTIFAARVAGRKLRVICLESRPNLEGRALAASLARAGFEVVVTTDAACYANLSETDLFLVGADSMTVGGVLNKMGTAALAASAQSCGVPGYALAATNKIWPERLGRPLLREYGPDEVWENRPDGVTVRNHYFDIAPWQAFAGVVTEEGILSRDEISRRCRAAEVHPVMSAIVAEVCAQA